MSFCCLEQSRHKNRENRSLRKLFQITLSSRPSPGTDENNVNVTISGDVLTIKGEKKKEQEKDEHHYRAERYYGSFQRSFRLPTSVQADKVEATFDKGILKLKLPEVEEAKKKQMEVKVR